MKKLKEKSLREEIWKQNHRCKLSRHKQSNLWRMSKQREAMEQMKAWFVQAQQECLQQLTEARDEKTRKTTASVTP